MRLGDLDALKKEIERTFDMQDLYLPVHFLDLIDNAPTVNPYFPFSEEALYKIMDVEWEHSDSFWITTPSGKRIEFEKKRQSEWIPVSERLPDVSQRYLVYTKYDEVMTDFFMGDEFMQGDDVIAWMPLPEKYNSEVKEE